MPHRNATVGTTDAQKKEKKTTLKLVSWMKMGSLGTARAATHEAVGLWGNQKVIQVKALSQQ